MPQPRASAVVLCGPSGAGKSRLARRLHGSQGWPVVQLDDFYKDGCDPSLPMSTLGLPDWDDPGSWHRDAAIEAIARLCTDGTATTPVYDIGRSAAVGERRIDLGAAPHVVAEGIFAAEIIADLAAAGLLDRAICVRQATALTFARRLVRDLSERRKPPWVLARRGWRLARAEPEIVARHVARGARPMTPAQAERALTGTR